MVLSASAACFVLTCVYSMGPFPRVMWTEPSKLSGAENGARGRAWEEQGIRDCQAALWGKRCSCLCRCHRHLTAQQPSYWPPSPHPASCSCEAVHHTECSPGVGLIVGSSPVASCIGQLGHHDKRHTLGRFSHRNWFCHGLETAVCVSSQSGDPADTSDQIQDQGADKFGFF